MDLISGTNVGDTISRQAAIDAIQKDREESWKDLEGEDDEYRSGCDDGYAYSMKVISELPSVERKTGKWIGEPKDGIEAMFFKPKCSVCGFESAEVKNYCPNCGSFNGGEE